MTTKETLEQARALIADPANWKQNGLAEVDEDKMEIVAPFCSLGAIGKTLKVFALGGGSGSRTGLGGPFFAQAEEENHGNPKTMKAYDEATKLLGECFDGEVHEYNDTHDHECVLAAFDAAIARAD